MSSTTDRAADLLRTHLVEVHPGMDDADVLAQALADAGLLATPDRAAEVTVRVDDAVIREATRAGAVVALREVADHMVEGHGFVALATWLRELADRTEEQR